MHNCNEEFTFALNLNHDIMTTKNIIQLEDGRYLFNDFGKYRPNLSFILPNQEDLKWSKIPSNSLNLEGRILDSVVGNFWVSRKGSNCFEPTTNGKHILIREDWGGSGDRGDLTQNESMLYFRRASSNGGGTGMTYAVLPINYKNKVSIDDI